MKLLFVLTAMFLSLNLLAKPPIKTVKPIYSFDFVLDKVLEYKKLDRKSSILNPKVYYKSQIKLKQFQDAIEKQWGQRPKEITNAFAIENNEIYLLDDADYYQRTKRCIDDSLAHEIVHFVQVKYQNYDINDESLEWEAVEIQTWFRENFSCN